MSTDQNETKALFRRAVTRASWAPSVHNTQPWHFAVRSEVLELQGDDDRQLRDAGSHWPSNGHQLRLCVVQCPSWFGRRPRCGVDRLPDPRTPGSLLDSPCLMSPHLGRRWSG